MVLLSPDFPDYFFSLHQGVSLTSSSQLVSGRDKAGTGGTARRPNNKQQQTPRQTPGPTPNNKPTTTRTPPDKPTGTSSENPATPRALPIAAAWKGKQSAMPWIHSWTSGVFFSPNAGSSLACCVTFFQAYYNIVASIGEGILSQPG